MNNIPTDWDVLNLGRNYTYSQTQVEPYNEFSNKIKDLYGAHAYAVSKRNVKDFCDYMESPDMLFWGPDPILIMKYYRVSNKCFAPTKSIVSALSEHYNDKNFNKTNECFNISTLIPFVGALTRQILIKHRNKTCCLNYLQLMLKQMFCI